MATTDVVAPAIVVVVAPCIDDRPLHPIDLVRPPLHPPEFHFLPLEGSPRCRGVGCPHPDVVLVVVLPVRESFRRGDRAAVGVGVCRDAILLPRYHRGAVGAGVGQDPPPAANVVVVVVVVVVAVASLVGGGGGGGVQRNRRGRGK